MKFSEIMIDLLTGDASPEDVRVKEAMGKLNVSSAIFEYANGLAEQEGSSFIQEAAEAAEEAGLPTNPAEAPGLATEAIQQELVAFYDVLVENAKKVYRAADRDMKAIVGMGKKYGISASAASSGSFMSSFARPLAKALVREFAKNRKGFGGNNIRFKRGVFPTSEYCHNLMFGYGNAMASLAAVFGLNISECIADPTVQEELSIDQNFLKALKAAGTGIIGGDPNAANAPKTGFSKSASDVKSLYKNLLKGSGYTPKLGKLNTTPYVGVEDLTDMIVYIYVVWQVSKGVQKAASGAAAKKAAVEFVAQLCGAEAARFAASDDKGKGKISKKFQQINDSIKGWAEDVSKSADMVVKSFSDAVCALGQCVTGDSDDITDNGEEAAAE